MKLHGKNCINYYSMICYMFAGKEEGKKKKNRSVYEVEGLCRHAIGDSFICLLLSLNQHF